LLFVSNTCIAQYWMGEFQIGAAAYNGDLTQNAFSFHRIRPAAGINVKYNSNDFVDFRIGVSWGIVTADDRFNKDHGLRTRNLNFTSNIFEIHAGVEANLVDPENHLAFPYLFAGAGIFHFNPYSFDKNNKKTYLHPLSTEGEGLTQYPDRKTYSLTQFCVPLGFGMKWKYKKGMEISYEFGYRMIFTDYLDDVSKTYVDLKTLDNEKGPKSVEMSYRRVTTPFNELGEARGNPKVKDLYYFSSIKLAFKLGELVGSKKKKSKLKDQDTTSK
jgi:Domain of unknown function (DUF6089)